MGDPAGGIRFGSMRDRPLSLFRLEQHANRSSSNDGEPTCKTSHAREHRTRAWTRGRAHTWLRRPDDRLPQASSCCWFICRNGIGSAANESGFPFSSVRRNCVTAIMPDLPRFSTKPSHLSRPHKPVCLPIAACLRDTFDRFFNIVLPAPREESDPLVAGPAVLTQLEVDRFGQTPEALKELAAQIAPRRHP